MDTKKNAEIIISSLKLLPEVLRNDKTLTQFSKRELSYIKEELTEELTTIQQCFDERILGYVEYFVVKILGDVYQYSSSHKTKETLGDLLFSLRIAYLVSGDDLLDFSEQEEIKNHTCTIFEYLRIEIDELLKEISQIDEQSDASTGDKTDNGEHKN